MDRWLHGREFPVETEVPTDYRRIYLSENMAEAVLAKLKKAGYRLGFDSGEQRAYMKMELCKSCGTFSAFSSEDHTHSFWKCLLNEHPRAYYGLMCSEVTAWNHAYCPPCLICRTDDGQRQLRPIMGASQAYGILRSRLMGFDLLNPSLMPHLYDEYAKAKILQSPDWVQCWINKHAPANVCCILLEHERELVREADAFSRRACRCCE